MILLVSCNSLYAMSYNPPFGEQHALIRHSHMKMHQANTDKETTSADNEISVWVAEQMGALMVEHGIPTRQQAALLNELCGLSLSQARRKLQGSTWSFEEVLTVTRRFGVSLDQLFANPPHADVAIATTDAGSFALPLQNATFLMDEVTIPCRVRLGALATTTGNAQLLTGLNQDVWYVGTESSLNRRHVTQPYYLAEQVQLTPIQTTPPVQIAILDDDIGTSETLCEWFNAAGYAATAFTSGEQLLASNIVKYDAFVVDYLLAAGDTSQKIIGEIRKMLPQAPIVLLTGKLRDGLVSEADLTTVLRTSKVTFFEKPVRPAVLAATIDKELDQAANRTG